MANDKEYEDKIEFMVETAKLQGAAAMSVSDGTVLLFNRKHLMELLEKQPNSEMVSVFVKHRQFPN